MITPCPHCSAGIEIDPATHATLSGQSHFVCPACQGAVPVPALERPRVQLNTAPGIRTTGPERPDPGVHKVATASRKTNRKLLILGTTALLLIGGIAFVLASLKSGDSNVTTQNIRNEIIHNSYFQNLIATGVTTEKDLQSLIDIRPFGSGFIGLSKEQLSWEQAQGLATQTGAEVLAVQDGAAATKNDLIAWVVETFGSQLPSSAWVRDHAAVRVLDGPDVLAISTMERPRKVLLQWGLTVGDGTADPEGNGPGRGKHIVLLAGDEEYRSEEALPMLAKLLSKKHGFKCTVVFSINKQTGEIDPNTKDNQPGIEALASADLCIISLRYRNWPVEQMKYFADYVAAGKPIIALRTSTHAFNGVTGQYAAFNNFGKEVLGEGWVSHWGKHKLEATRGVVEETAKDDPLLRGVTDLFGDTDVYEAAPPPDARILVRGLVLNGMAMDASPADYIKMRADKQEQAVNSPPMPILWSRIYDGSLGDNNQVLCSTMGAATDFASEGLRRVIVNAAYAFTGIEVPAKAHVAPVDDFKPSNYGFDGFIRGVTPVDFMPGRK